MSADVSVVIPSFNYGEFVVEAVESALQQTRPAREVIVVDDGSTDDTRARLSPYAGRIRYIHQENQGLSASRNRGIREAAGQWIAFLDADDRWHPEKLEVQLEAVSSLPDVRFFGGPATLGEFPPHLPRKPHVRALEVRDFLGRLPLGPSSAVVHSSCFADAGLFDESLRSVEDRDMWLRLSVRFAGAAIDSLCWWYRQHPLQMNRNAKRMHENFERVLRRFFAEHRQFRRYERFAWAYMYMDSGYSHFLAGDRRKARELLLRSLWLHPRALTRPAGPDRLKLLMRLVAGEAAWQAVARSGEGRRA